MTSPSDEGFGFSSAGFAVLVAAVYLTAAAAGTGRAADPSAYPKGTTLFQGVIVNVISAGEMVVWEKGRLHPFRLYGIDLPEPDSTQGAKAKQIVSDLVFNTLLQVYFLPGETEPPNETDPVSKTDLPGAIVMIRGTCLNHTLVCMGTARLSETCTLPAVCTSWKCTRQQAGDMKGVERSVPCGKTP